MTVKLWRVNKNDIVLVFLFAMQMVQKHQKQRDHQTINNHHRVIHFSQNLDREGHKIMEEKDNLFAIFTRFSHLFGTKLSKGTKLDAGGNAKIPV